MGQKKITDLQLRSLIEAGCNFIVDDGIQNYRVTAPQIFNYLRPLFTPQNYEISNLQIVTSVGSNALTIALKTNAGTDPSANDAIRVCFRSATITSGAFLKREITDAVSFVVSSGSKLGQVDGQPSAIWVYLIDNAGTPELAVSHTCYPEDALVSTTAEGGAGAADSATVIYSTTARSNVAIRLIGYILNTQSTAGTWASAGAKIQLMPSYKGKEITIQKFLTGTGTYITPAGCTRIRVRMAGGGGGGSGSGTADGNPVAGHGADTTFGSSLLIANGGLRGNFGSLGGDGGAFTINSPAVGFGVAGGKGNGFSFCAVQGYHLGRGAAGGNSVLGGSGGSSHEQGAGYAGVANSGGGGGGAAPPNLSNGYSGAGGGGGGYLDAIINNPLASYAYVVGSGGTAGAAGTSGYAGAAGGSGVIIVEEYYD